MATSANAGSVGVGNAGGAGGTGGGVGVGGVGLNSTSSTGGVVIPRGPQLPVTVQKANREDINDKFCKFEINKSMLITEFIFLSFMSFVVYFW